MESHYDLRPLWDELLLIYGIIADICNRNNLRFYANGGTALGALRHKGFIPWDDDLDLYMPRPDYEAFKIIAQRELKQPYVWQSIETDPTYACFFGKVRLTDQKKVERLSQKTAIELKDGVFVDIFALDGFPSGKVGYLMFCLKRGLMRRSLGGDHWWGRLVGMGKDVHANYLKMQTWYSSFKYDECDLVSAVSPYDNFKTPQRWIFRQSWFKSVTEMKFENTTIPVPEGAHEILSGQFGDYMKLPPVKDRVPKHSLC